MPKCSKNKGTMASPLFQLSQVIAEFQQIKSVQLEPKFMSSLDLHIPKLLTMFHGKGGALGERLKTEMELLNVQFIMMHASQLVTCCFM
ncbi:hypothetical protein QTP86_017013 [Hemibagrus guttatus]|nr:hypothetical protein QTP86_017013 [Hemibagrus guttatus]